MKKNLKQNLKKKKQQQKTNLNFFLYVSIRVIPQSNFWLNEQIEKTRMNYGTLIISFE